MNKKGILMKNVMGILIAVIGLALLLVGSIGLYKRSISSDQESAQEIINILEARIKLIETGQRGEIPITGLGSEWNLLGFGKNDRDKPDKCLIDSCICVCKTSCQELSFCRKIDTEKINILQFETKEVCTEKIEPSDSTKERLVTKRGFLVSCEEITATTEKIELKQKPNIPIINLEVSIEEDSLTIENHLEENRAPPGGGGEFGGHGITGEF